MNSTSLSESLYVQLCEYIDVLGAPVLAVNGIKPDGTCTCGKQVCPSAGKHPAASLCPRGVKDATLDKKLLAEWVSRGAHLNWAIATGKPLPMGGFLIVLDVDPRNGGDASLEQMQEDHGQLKSTPMQLTGGGGFHYLFAADAVPGGSVIAPGLDIKGEGGYIMVAPSMHASGRSYIWDLGYGLDTLIEDAPTWLIAGKAPKARPPWTGKQAKDSVIGIGFDAAGWLGHETTEGRWTVHCPWSNLHTDGRGRGGDSSTVILPPSDESPSGGFSCRHEHCKSKGWKEAMSSLPVDASKAARKRFEVVQPLPEDGTPLAKSIHPIVTGALTPEEMQELRSYLQFNVRKDKSQVLKPDLVNIVAILRYDPRWRGVIAFDDFAYQIQVLKSPPWHKDDKRAGDVEIFPRGWTDEDAVRLILWFQRFWGIELDDKRIAQAVVTVAQANGFHPVRSYLKSIEWDGVERVDRWLHDYCGAARNDYTRLVGRWWLLSAVARVMRPGCKADHVLILEGIQGIGKSTTFKVLGGEWFCDSTIDLGNKDAYQVIKGRWIVELAELDSLNRADSSRAKAFFTSPNDTYRPSYGRNVITVQRQCVFAGTVNQSQFLRDETGNRRYWPVLCTQLDLDALTRDRDMIWAEALRLFESSATWWPMSVEERALCSVEQQQREFVDEWKPVIARWLAGPDARNIYNREEFITSGDVLEHALKLPVDRWGPTEMLRVNRCMQQLEWAKTRIKGTRTWGYQKVEAI